MVENLIRIDEEQHKVNSAPVSTTPVSEKSTNTPVHETFLTMYIA